MLMRKADKHGKRRDSRSDRRRLVWSLLASAIFNVFAWMTVSFHVSSLLSAPAEEPRETAVVLSSIRIERPKHRRQMPRPAPAAQETILLAPPQPASLALPRTWAKQDFGYLAATDTTTWLDWKNQSGTWVPRVFLWQMKEEAGYMRRPSLQDAVHNILRSLRAEDARVYASKTQRVCNGERTGWFLSYVKPGDDPPLHFDETLFMAGETIYRATYIRAAGQPEDIKTRDALNSLCWP